LPVNAAAVAHIPDLFATNERLVCYLDTERMGRVAVVAVGAYNVGRISAAFDAGWNAPEGASGWVTNLKQVVEAETHRYEPPVPVGQGEQIMAFHLGSTVVLLWEAGRGELAEGVEPGAPIRLGAPLLREG
jgi:phosphatidylserine decarboxylase